MKLLLYVKSRIVGHYKEGNINRYLGNLLFLFLMIITMQLMDYFFWKIGNNLPEAILSGIIIFLILAVPYTLPSPSLYGWIIKKSKNKS